jgi:SOS-response transcriptional repressor LexA
MFPNIANKFSFMETVEIIAALPKRHNKAHIPILENGIAAGFPSPALDYMEKDIDLGDYLIKHPQATFI